jgi:two-component system invasion response regulator UvrY
VRVIAVDDNAPYLLVARRVVDATPGFCGVGGLSTGREILAAMESAEPDLALVDINMPEMDGIEVARTLRQGHPDVFVVLISADDPRVAAARTRESAPVVTKEDLKPSVLRDLWDARPAA